jgi:hypothetical protein
MAPWFCDLWRRWFLVDPDGERPARGPYDSEADAARDKEHETR